MSEIKNGEKYQKVPDSSILNTANTGMKIIDNQNIILDFEFCDKINEFQKCVCKIESSKYNTEKISGTGLFCYIPSINLKVLITNYHIINKKYLDQEKELKLYFEYKGISEEKILNLKAKRLKYTDEKLDATVIEILDEDLIDNYFEVDEEIIKDNKFLGETIFNLQFLKGRKLKISFGEINESINEDTLFKYDAGTEFGSSGSPIISTNGYKLIGMHRGTLEKGKNNYANKQNAGIYLDKIINSIPKLSRTENKNIIKCLYDVKEEDVNKVIQVYDNSNNIEKDIKYISIYREDEEKRQIKNGKCRFEKEGKYFIFYELDKSATNLKNLFNKCSSLTRVYMPSFNDNKIKNMSKMFSECSSLKEINFSSSCNTIYVEDISNMFSYCISLEKINLSSFNTENVINMSGLFKDCNSLKNINLSSFNTKNVEDMSNMFQECFQLKEINLSSFKTDFTSYFTSIFEECISLQKLDLSAFDMSKVIIMKDMFKNCRALKIINLKEFKVNNSAITKGMFSACNLLKDIGSCTDTKIRNEYEHKN